MNLPQAKNTGLSENVSVLLVAAFGVAFLVQVIFKQLLVRLEPYLFGMGVSNSEIIAGNAVAQIATNTAAVLGIFALVAVGAHLSRVRAMKNEGRPTVGRAVLLLTGYAAIFFGLLIGFMDLTHLALSPSAYVALYGSESWLDISILLAVLGIAVPAFLVGGLLSDRPRAGLGNRALHYSLAMLSVGVLDMGIYSLLLRAGGYVSPSLIGLAYNLSMNLFGVSISIISLWLLFKVANRALVGIVVLSALTTSFLAFAMYSGEFSYKTMELTWETSFGTPLPLPWGLVYGFFFVSLILTALFLALAGRGSGYLFGSFGLVALMASIYLVPSASLVYAESALLGFVSFVWFFDRSARAETRKLSEEEIAAKIS
ncbi:MAG: hypothetical protein JRN52_03705 [Nitrososphaerota archaeon]|nr:hypothetical protein [Nitrososphaerota archaeon]